MSNFTIKENDYSKLTQEIIYGSTKIFEDSRGDFRETYTKKVIEEIGITDTFVQSNMSISKRGVVRGLHFQKPPKAQSKFVQVLKGIIWDYIVDIRKSSSTYGKLFRYTLKSGDFLYVPVGFAHGFLSLEDNTMVQYMCNEYYSIDHEGGINPFDNEVGFLLEEERKDVTINGKDLQWPTWDEFVSPFD